MASSSIEALSDWNNLSAIGWLIIKQKKKKKTVEYLENNLSERWSYWRTFLSWKYLSNAIYSIRYFKGYLTYAWNNLKMYG